MDHCRIWLELSKVETRYYLNYLYNITKKRSSAAYNTIQNSWGNMNMNIILATIISRCIGLEKEMATTSVTNIHQKCGKQEPDNMQFI